MTTPANPVLVERFRGEFIESQHRGSVVICDPKGRVIKSWGDCERLVYPRSAIKALQALPMIETGAAEAYQLSNAEIALACSSHGGESFHVNTVAAWLDRLNLSVNDLECGPADPLNHCAHKHLIRENIDAGRIYNNCSGKHTGMLTLARHLNQSCKGYIEQQHQVQQHWIKAVSEMTQCDLNKLPASFDGCGIPVIAVPLKGIASAFARFSSPDQLPQSRADAIDKITQAVSAHPEMVAGTDRVCTEVMRTTGKRVFIKTGAEGVFIASIPALNLGIALKIDDGLTSAAEVALLATLKYVGCLNSDDVASIQDKLDIPIKNTLGVLTGYQRASSVFEGKM